jgi:hypothetical protein
VLILLVDLVLILLVDLVLNVLVDLVLDRITLTRLPRSFSSGRGFPKIIHLSHNRALLHRTLQHGVQVRVQWVWRPTVWPAAGIA